ncbi:hypothetical protein MB02_12000 [Croceicoccus estronivorus]|uniref:PAS domain S-box protein n=1 Tax=Croceicoccus estronivorus TaxID=1172626 RepID=UPI00082F876F|nr:PAS domain S-box protein [Croceicoccus estronivorus]OCC23345.1 hypothetical protein MB02_12000 [Croceicoccus estronivorus]
MKVLERDRAPGGSTVVFGTLLIAAGFAFFAWLGITLTRDVGRIAAVWLPNAMLVAAILQDDWRRAFPKMVACNLANVAVGLAMGDGPTIAIALAACNTVEVAIVYFAVRRLAGAQPELTDIKALAWFSLIGGLVAPTVSASIATMALILAGIGRTFDTWMTWLAADGLGMLVGTPLFVVLFRALQGTVKFQRKEAVQWLAVMGIGTFGTALVFAQSSYPFLFMASLFVLFAAFRLGMTGAAAATAIVAILAMVATANDVGPIHLVHGDLKSRVLVLQIFLAFTFAGAIPVAAVLASRDQFEKELTKSRDYARSILNNMREIIFRTDMDGRWTFLNPAWEKLTGYSIAESLGQHVSVLLLPEEQARAHEQYARLFRGEVEDLVLQQKFRRADGATRYVEVNIRAIRDENNWFVGSTGNIRDVTEAREAQHALGESEKRFQQLANLSPAGVFRTALNGECTYVNAAWMGFAGMRFEDAMGDGWVQGLHPGDAERLGQRWQVSVETGAPFREEFRFRRPDGHITPVMAVAAAEVDEDGNTTGHIGVVLDFSDVVEARRELEEERGRFKYLAENATDAIISAGPDGICRFVSQAIYDLTGYTPEEVIGKPVYVLPGEEDAVELKAAYEGLFGGEFERTKLAYRIEHKTKGWRWHESHIRLIRNLETGEPLETIASVRDITERVALEEQLRRARDAAEQAAQAKSSFLANMSHEIRTPMNGVNGFADLLLETNLDPLQRQYAELIAESGQSMVALINDILDLSKIDAGQLTIATDPMDLRHTVEGTLRLMRAAATKKGLSIEADYDPAIGKAIIGDRLRLRQIISNLVGNAIKFTDEGSVKVSAMLRDGDDVPQLRLDVTDTGIGIAKGRQEAIFDEFVQADGSTVRKYGGTGLGLAISRRLAELMGGSLSVRSSLGKGATFTLTIPYRPTSRKVPRRDERNAERRSVPRAEVDERCVLLAEDHEINRLLLTALIDKAGYRFEIAEDGLEAVRKVREAAKAGTPYAMVLMDIQMPNLDGFDATRRIREMGFSADDLPIVAITANAYQSDVEQCLAAGMQGHLAKPVQMDQLGRIFDAWLPKRRDDDHPDGADDSVVALRPRYERFKRETLDQLEKCFQRLPRPDTEDLAELKRLMHKLSGSAAMFGDEALGDLARELEDAIEAMEQGAAEGRIEDVITDAHRRAGGL